MPDQNQIVSILIPLYNHEAYIVECLNALKNQTYQHFEIIIINDGSTDNSDMIVKHWISQNPSITIHYSFQKNHGITKTLNTMVNQAKGNFIAVCASDDVLTPDSLETRIRFLKDHPQYDAVIGDAIVIGSHSELIHKSAMKSLFFANYKRLKNNIVEELVLNWSVAGPTFLTKRELYDQIGLYDESLAIEDREFYLRILSLDKLAFVPKPVAKYRIHTSNISRKNKTAKFNIYRQVALSNLKHSQSFNHANKLFLKSHAIDLFLSQNGYSLSRFYMINTIRFLRKIIFKSYLAFR